MIEVYEKRGKWHVFEEDEKRGVRSLLKFATEDQAKLAAGWIPPVEESLSKIETILDGSEEEEKSSKEKTRPYKHAPVLGSKKLSKKKI
tara:strand:- start:503 stop:769 length:267 start_codon:yes stop_codon:yes gene_type:complete